MQQAVNLCRKTMLVRVQPAELSIFNALVTLYATNVNKGNWSER